MERILVIDDEASICKALKMGLASEKFEIDLANDGLSGIQLGQKQVYDILIADLSLPDIHGLEVIKKLKLTNPEIIPIIITGNGSMQSSLKAIRLEVSDYLEKPLSLASVKGAIERGLKRRERLRKSIENKAYQNLVSDSLTGLPDRPLFMDRLNEAIAAIDRHEDRSFAVLLISIDDFKSVNDIYGHNTGDRVLAELAKRFKSCVRPIDTVARMNGDEFAVLIEEAENYEEVIAIAEGFQRAAEKDISIDGTRMKISVSIGIVAKTIFYQSPDDVLRDAELAISRCKEQDGGLFKVFDNTMLEQAIDSLQLENDMRMGVQNQEFILYYQPIIRLDDMRLAGLEALIRWNHPEQGLLYSNEFIPKAEEIGLINRMGNWVLSEGCRQIKEWRSTLPNFEDIYLSINIAGQQIVQPGFADMAAATIRQHDLDPEILKFELAESVLMENSGSLTEYLAAMKKNGFKLTIDAFGTGFTSFSYLRQFSIDDLKIDQSFIQQLAADPETYEIVNSIVDLAKKLGLNVVAEGVETEAQFNQVKSLDFDMAQGLGIAKPGDAATVVERIQKYL